MSEMRNLEELLSEANHELNKEALKLGMVVTALSTMQSPESVSIDDILGAGYTIEDTIIKINELTEWIDLIRLKIGRAA